MRQSMRLWLQYWWNSLLRYWQLAAVVNSITWDFREFGAKFSDSHKSKGLFTAHDPCNSITAICGFVGQLTAFKRAVKRADLSAFLLCNCPWCVLFSAFIFISYILVMLAQFCAILLFLWTPVSARILASVLQLYERNKPKTEKNWNFFLQFTVWLTQRVARSLGGSRASCFITRQSWFPTPPRKQHTATSHDKPTK